MDAIDFVFAASGAETKVASGRHQGEVLGVWVNHTSGTPTLTVKSTALGVDTTIYSKTSPADGAFNPVTRMQTTAGADNSGVGEFTRITVAPGSTVSAIVDGAWTGSVRLVLRK